MRQSLYIKIYHLVAKSFDKTMGKHNKLYEKSEQLENRSDKIFQRIILKLQFDIEYIKLKLYKWFFKISVERIKKRKSKGTDFKETEEKKWIINTNIFIMVLVKGLM